MSAQPHPPGRWSRLRALLLPDCQEMARRSSCALDRPLTAGERGGAWLHLAFCRLCRRYRRQLLWLRRLIRHNRTLAGGRARLSPAARARLKAQLRHECPARPGGPGHPRCPE